MLGPAGLFTNEVILERNCAFNFSALLLCGSVGKATISAARRGLKIEFIYPTKLQVGKSVVI